jgi:signal transduction histidine kinase/phage shock protein PspC (stress-responsive transcriptional regulator)
MLGGVAGGLAAKIGRDPTIVRVVLLLAGLAGGFGFGVYVVAWLLLPVEGDTEPIARRALGDSRGIALAISLIPVLVIGLLVGKALAAPLIGEVSFPTIVGISGLVLIWRNANADEQAFLRRAVAPLRHLVGPASSAAAEDERSASLLRLGARLLITAALVVSGLVLLLIDHPSHLVLRPLGGLLLIVAAIVVLFGPWWLRIAQELVLERQARARAEERADLAARVHDSVLQTLALIQRKADQPQQVVQLARAQERELRSWLFGGDLPGSASEQDATFSAGVQRIQAEVEALHGLPVEAVVVGDCPLDDGLRAMLAAGREAAVNAAKWSGAPTVSLFGEIEAKTVSLFVRDRGVGFDPETVGEDRKGLAESVRVRMARHGGSVQIRSARGEGTEVALSMAREASARKTVAPT